MDAELAVSQILEDEGLTGDLDEAEATVLTQWLCAEVKTIASHATSEEAGWKLIKARKQLARKIAKTVATFRDDGPVKAGQYALQEHLPGRLRRLLRSNHCSSNCFVR
ncbi:MAG: hypothetical protein QM703_02925 [Gemmatales bacterium]